MDVLWAALITVEKTLPWRRLVVWGTTALLLALAVMLIVAPHSVPGLVVPDAHSPLSMSGMPHSMNSMPPR